MDIYELTLEIGLRVKKINSINFLNHQEYSLRSSPIF